jgi:hypothetical protein
MQADYVELFFFHLSCVVFLAEVQAWTNKPGLAMELESSGKNFHHALPEGRWLDARENSDVESTATCL